MDRDGLEERRLIFLGFDFFIEELVKVFEWRNILDFCFGKIVISCMEYGFYKIEFFRGGEVWGLV